MREPFKEKLRQWWLQLWYLHVNLFSNPRGRICRDCGKWVTRHDN